MRWLIVLVPGLLVASVAQAADYVGAEQCGTCHEKEYADWKASGHATALARLSKRQAADPACRGCHTTSPDKDDPRLAGVQCESCHGAGSLYAPRYVMRDERLAKLLGLEEVTKDTCRACHSADTPNVAPFVYETAVQLVNHSKANSPEDAAEVEATRP